VSSPAPNGSDRPSSDARHRLNRPRRADFATSQSAKRLCTRRAPLGSAS
jgi:hypothetical protein